MPLRKASSYSKHQKMSYTRKSSVKSKNYVKAVPASHITKYQMGDIRKFNEGKFPFIVELLSKEDIHIRDNAIEAARQHVHRELDNTFKGNYYFGLMVYPHHVLRENKMLTGAGADRMQTGMTLSFGVPIGIAAHIGAGHTIFQVAVQNQKDTVIVREILKKCRAKLACATKIAAKETKV